VSAVVREERSGGHGEAGCEHVTAGKISHCESSSIGKIGGFYVAPGRRDPAAGHQRYAPNEILKALA
jgi:hypothetical protein